MAYSYLIVGSGLTANELEARFYELCARIGFPRPEVQVRMPERRRIDFLFRDLGLIVETDGRRTHGTFVAFLDDRVRDRAHTLAGYRTLRSSAPPTRRSSTTRDGHRRPAARLQPTLTKTISARNSAAHVTAAALPIRRSSSRQ